MFTGIVEIVGSIRSANSNASGKRLYVTVGGMATECPLGASVAIDGVCLTVCERDRAALGFDVVQETLQKTTLGSKKSGDRVNVERSLRIGDRLDGHFVQGHVDGTGQIVRLAADSTQHVVWFRTDSTVNRFIVPKGAVAIDGVSLTIAELCGDAFSVALIPTTLSRTTLRDRRMGDRVNIETDLIVRAVVQSISGFEPDREVRDQLMLARLTEAGFA